MEQVFISYARRDYLDENDQVIPGNIVSRIKDVLTREGISYWFDEEGITHGDDFPSVIVKHIRNCDVFLFISSGNSNKSVWTSKEIATAFNEKKIIIPFRIDSAPFEDSIDFYLSNLDYIEYYKNPEKAISGLTRDLRKYIVVAEKERHRKKRLNEIKEEKSKLNAKKTAVDDKLKKARQTVDTLTIELDELNASLEKLIAEEIILSGDTPPQKKPPVLSSPKDSPALSVNFLQRWKNDIAYHWKANPTLVNVWAVLGIIATGFLLFKIFGINASDLIISIGVKFKIEFKYVQLAIIAFTFFCIWAIYRLFRKDAVSYIYFLFAPIASILYLIGSRSFHYLKPYGYIMYVIGAVSLLGILLLASRKNGIPFKKMVRFNIKDTFKSWSQPAIWVTAVFLLMVFGVFILHFLKS